MEEVKQEYKSGDKVIIDILLGPQAVIMFLNSEERVKKLKEKYPSSEWHVIISTETYEIIATKR